MANKLKLATKACPTCGGSGSIPDDGAGPVLREERIQAGIEAKQMAAAISVSESYLYDLEKGNRRWTNELLHAYQRVLREGIPA